MQFFLSGELETQVASDWMRVSNRVEKKLNEFFLDRDYGPAIHEIGIIPMILHPERQHNRRERRLFQRKQKAADYRTWIDFEKVKAGSDELREKLLLKNILEAVTDLARKAGKAFTGERLIEDMLALFQVSRQEIESA